jgi:hypothetical protein
VSSPERIGRPLNQDRAARAVATQGLANKQAMRNVQNKRMRGRNNRGKGQNPLSRVYESNGPDVKIRGAASHVAEKYVQLARDAHSSGDPVAAENYYQHAEHYFRLIATAQEQFRQNPPFYRPEGSSGNDTRDEVFDDDDGDGDGEPGPATAQGEQPSFGTTDPQPYLPRDAQFFSPREQQHQQQPRQFRDRHQQGERQHHERPPQAERQPQAERPPRVADVPQVDRLPSFITGGQPPQAAAPGGNGPNGFEGQGERFPLHRRRRRHRGPRSEMGAPAGAEGGEDSGPRE